jgi:MFS transporter, MHS family, proline/betaine transporter
MNFMFKVIISSMIGNTLEWFEYTIYAQFVSIIAKHFFPESELSELFTWILFAAGFIVRPLGGLFFGVIGDKEGRRSALSLSIVIMTLSTTLMGLLPSYSSIGILAPVFLSIFRIMQGFSLGGEFSSCICYMVEHSNPKIKGLIGSLSFVGMNLGILLGLFIARYMFENIDYNDLFEWKWRIPFVLSSLIGFVGFYIRKRVAESPLYTKIKENRKISESPVKDLFIKHKKAVLVGIGIYVNVTSCFYTLSIYLQNILQQKEIGFSQPQASFIIIIGLVALTVSILASGFISDKIGRRGILILGNLLLITYSYYFFSGLTSKTYEEILYMSIIFNLLLGFYMGPVPVSLVEIFSTNVRSTGVGVSYNISAAIFGGTVPVIAKILYSETANIASLSYYLILTGTISLIVVLFLFDENKNEKQ